MRYCKAYDNEEEVDCAKCHKDNNFPNNCCCLEECGEHQWCKLCLKNKTTKQFLTGKF